MRFSSSKKLQRNCLACVISDKMQISQIKLALGDSHSLSCLPFGLTIFIYVRVTLRLAWRKARVKHADAQGGTPIGRQLLLAFIDLQI